MTNQRPEHRSRYLIIWLMAALIPTIAVFSLNWLVDPLWYGRGNRIFDENFPYNERFSKALVFLRDPQRFDCVVLGSSRTTLLDASRIEGSDCFNFSVSNGNLLEYPALVRFAAAYTELDTVVLGLDGFNFADHGLSPALPGFVEKLEPPPPMLESYLSFDVFDFSARSLVSRSSRTRYYDSDYQCRSMPNATPFVPVEAVASDDPFGGLASSPTNTTGPFRASNAAFLNAVKSAAPGVGVWIGYVPPLLSHHVAHIEAAGNLDGYLRSIWRASREVDRLLDFSVPSEISSNPKNTYDGSHFYRKVNDRVAELLASGRSPAALPVHEMRYSEYREAFLSRLSDFKNRNRSIP